MSEEKKMISRRRRDPVSNYNHMAQGIKMIFEHDSEEEAELEVIDKNQNSDSSSSEEEEDENKIKTDIIKYKKNLQRQKEKALRKI